MPHSLTWEKFGVHLKFSGDVSVRSRLDALNAVCGNARFDSVRYVIVDYLDVGAYEVVDGAIEEMAAMQIGAFLTNPQVVIANVAVQPHVIAAVAELMGLGFISAPQVIVPTVEEARRWIAERRPAPPHGPGCQG